MLVGIEQIDRRQRPCRVGGDRLHHPPESLDQRLDAGRVEHVGAKLHRPADPGRRTGLTPAFGQRKHQIHAGGVGVGRQRGDLHITQRQPGGGIAVRPGQVLPGQHHLHQRVMGQRSGRVEPIHQHLEGHVLMLVGGQGAPAHLGQQLGDTGITGHLDPQHQGVDEKPHQLIERRVAPPGDREPHRHLRAGADLGQQHRQGGLHHHETGRVVRTSHPGNLLLQLRRPVHRHPGAAVIGHRRIGPIGGQHQLLGHPGQGLLPVGQLRGDRAVAVRRDHPAAPAATACNRHTAPATAPSRGPARRTGWHRPPPDHPPAG